MHRWTGALALLACAACGKTSAPLAGADAGAVSATVTTAAPSTAKLDVPGVDAGDLSAREAAETQQALEAILSPCPEVPVSIAQCLREKRACATCGRAARFVEVLVKQGMPAQLVAHMVKNRYDPSAVHDFPVGDMPARGSASAPVTIVELASFGCSHCEAEAPKLDAIVAKHPGEVKLVFYSVGQGTAEAAGAASLAAANQGKYWEMHDLLFKRFGNFEETDLDANAKTLGLDVKRFDADRKGPAVAAKLALSRAMFDKLGLRSTPSIFVNGRLVAGMDVGDWVEEEVAALHAK